MKIIRKIKNIKNGRDHQSLNKETLNIAHFLFLVVISLFLAIVFFYLNALLNLNIENTMTGYIALLGSMPTIYLWIIKERKKEVELENKQIVKALVYFKNEETNLNAIDLSNPIVEWVDDFLD